MLIPDGMVVSSTLKSIMADMAAAMNIEAIATGRIESEEQLELLRSIDITCNVKDRYLVARFLLKN